MKVKNREQQKAASADPASGGPAVRARHSNGDEEKWLASLEYVMECILKSEKPERASLFIDKLLGRLLESGIKVTRAVSTPYLNTISAEEQPPYPGDRELERRIKSYIRWNAMAMVVNANHTHNGIGGHISTFASSATLYEVGFNHFFRGGEGGHPADMIYFQGHAAPGHYARAFLEGRLESTHLEHFRQELAEGGGLSSYPHPYLMPGFWQFPTVSMGLGPILSIYQARFNRYLKARGFLKGEEPKVWCFLGDGETDEPESLGSLTLAARENLDNLVWVVNCNLQRLDGPVRGNGKIIQELE
ncbi:MAG: pyruvate dehydrogenase (acetyl-transferring), homodimeric type, partial [Chloroflexi bacterium]|nr:pyruvate dehydrogenase (acetyl-transferring), homodimeric type [Chloroflexota bacterium]